MNWKWQVRAYLYRDLIAHLKLFICCRLYWWALQFGENFNLFNDNWENHLKWRVCQEVIKEAIKISQGALKNYSWQILHVFNNFYWLYWPRNSPYVKLYAPINFSEKKCFSRNFFFLVHPTFFEACVRRKIFDKKDFCECCFCQLLLKRISIISLLP